MTLCYSTTLYRFKKKYYKFLSLRMIWTLFYLYQIYLFHDLIINSIRTIDVCIRFHQKSSMKTIRLLIVVREMRLHIFSLEVMNCFLVMIIYPYNPIDLLLLIWFYLKIQCIEKRNKRFYKISNNYFVNKLWIHDGETIILQIYYIRKPTCYWAKCLIITIVFESALNCL